MLAAAFLPLLAAAAYGQGGRSSDNNLYPQPALPLYLGPELGYGSWSNKGSFIVSDSRLPCAEFTDGDGTGPTAGVKAYIYLNRWFMIAPRFRYEARSGTFLTPLADEPTRDASNQVTMLSQEGEADVTMAAFTFDTMLGFEIAHSGAYIVTGFSSSLLMDGIYDYTERLKSPGLVYSDTKANQHLLISGKSFDTYQRFAFDLRGGVGYLYKFGRWAVNPEAFYSLPLTSALGDPDKLKQTGIVGTLGLLYNFGD
jgi:hypothetical protein